MTISRRFSMTAAAMLTTLGITSAMAADTFMADAAHSSIIFRIKHMNTSYCWGRFNDITGTFSIDEADPSKSVLDFKVKTASVDTAQPKRDMHLKSPDFFNAVQYPTITFKSTTAAKSGTTYEVTGDLTLHGVTKPVLVKLTPTGSGKGPTGAAIAGIEATFSIKRTDFGMDKMVGAVGDDIWITVSVEGAKK